MDMWVCATGAWKSLEPRCQRTACLEGEAKCTVCAFPCESWVDTKRGYVGRYEERLAQQESGVALPKSSTYVSGRPLYKVCINYNRWIALHVQLIQKQNVFK